MQRTRTEWTRKQWLHNHTQRRWTRMTKQKLTKAGTISLLWTYWLHVASSLMFSISHFKKFEIPIQRFLLCFNRDKQEIFQNLPPKISSNYEVFARTLYIIKSPFVLRKKIKTQEKTKTSKKKSPPCFHSESYIGEKLGFWKMELGVRSRFPP